MTYLVLLASGNLGACRQRDERVWRSAGRESADSRMGEWLRRPLKPQGRRGVAAYRWLEIKAGPPSTDHGKHNSQVITLPRKKTIAMPESAWLLLLFERNGLSWPLASLH
jgi:hypothetical protein